MYLAALVVMNILRASLLVATLVTLLTWTPSVSAPFSASVSATAPSPATSPVSGDDAAVALAADTVRAREVLDGLRATYRYLDGVTVRFDTTPKSEEAVAYYMQGDIVISRAHAVDVETILAHEIWHVIDWRDNGRLDWGEHLPPINSYAYLNR